MKSITIKNIMNDYNVILGAGSFKYFFDNFNFPSKVMVITTDDLYNKYLSNLNKSFDYYYLPDGEKEKSMENYSSILNKLIELEYSKSDLIIAFGGGVILDLAGFISGTYKRGINLIMIPTTLLSMVDASIGGKNGINFNGIKNMIGMYYMPNMIVDDLELLDSLDDKSFTSGLMESLKMGIIGDIELYNLIKDNDLKKIRNNIFLLEEIIERSINVKKKIVETDPFEVDLRRVLNLGHTIGHAIEASNIGLISHGYAVGLGMIPFLDGKLKDEVKNILYKYLNKESINIDIEKYLELIKEDKKIKNDKINIIYANDIMDIEIKEISLEELREKINEINIW